MLSVVRVTAAALLGGGLLFAVGCDMPASERLLAPETSSTSLAGLTWSSAGPAVGAAEVRTGTAKRFTMVRFDADPSNRMAKNSYGFEAKRTSRGAAIGLFQFTGDYGRINVHVAGVVTCYVVEGNRARVGGVVTASDFSGIPIGETETWSVTHNSDARDTGSPFMGGDAEYALNYCAHGLPYTEYPFISGSVNITR